MNWKPLIIGSLLIITTIASVMNAIQVVYASEEDYYFEDYLDIPPSTSVGPAGQSSNASNVGTYEYPEEPVDPFKWYTPLNVWVVADEEFRSQSYPTTWFQSVSWQDYARSVIIRGSYILADTFNINLDIVDFGQWSSTAGQTPKYLINEVIAQTGFKSGETCLEGSYIDVLVAFTGQEIKSSRDERLAGATLTSKRVILMKYNAYWADDNVVAHEASHIFGPKGMDHEDESYPHYFDDCVMSYRKVHVDFWTEDGWIWYVGRDVRVAGLSGNWCEDCKYNIRLYRSPWYFHKNPGWNWKWVPK